MFVTVKNQIENTLKQSEQFKDIDFNIAIFGSLVNGLFEKTNSDLDLTINIADENSVD